MSTFPDIAREVQRFRRWADSGAPDTLGLGHGAEWESNYPSWDALYAAVEGLLGRPEALDECNVELLLFTLARDNEDERVAQMLAAVPDVLKLVLDRAIRYPDAQARWQIAAILPRALGDEGKASLSFLEQDDDEYVRRRAIAALRQL